MSDLSDLHNPRTLPLIKYLLRSHAQLKEDAGKNLFSVIKNPDDDVKDPIDESFENFKEYMSLIQNPITTKFSGKSVCFHFINIAANSHSEKQCVENILTRRRSPSLVLVYRASVLPLN
jgi:hypothetical protein